MKKIDVSDRKLGLDVYQNFIFATNKNKSKMRHYNSQHIEVILWSEMKQHILEKMYFYWLSNHRYNQNPKTILVSLQTYLQPIFEFIETSLSFMKNQHNGTIDRQKQIQISAFTFLMEHTKLSPLPNVTSFAIIIHLQLHKHNSMQHFNRYNKCIIKISIISMKLLRLKLERVAPGQYPSEEWT